MVSHGGQNPLEPAREGNYILYGPHVDNFKEVYQTLRDLKIANKINSIKNIKNFIIQKINYSENKKIKYKLNYLGNKIINKNIFEIKRFI